MLALRCIKSIRPRVALAFVLILLPSSLHAWSREGHQIIAMLAEQRLQAEVIDRVNKLLGGTSFVEASVWADKVRNEQTAPWHYVNIPLQDTKYEASRVCPNNQCVIGQIERFTKTLENPATDFKKRQKALKYLIH